MKICLISEGSYPFVTGGVSSWIQSLISNMPEHEFIIFAIGAEKNYKGKYNYKIPSNVIKIEELFLDTFIDDKGDFGKRYWLKRNLRRNIANLINGQDVDFKVIFDYFNNKKINILDFFMSKDIFDLIKNEYQKKYSLIPFTEFFWSTRSMLIPLFHVMSSKNIEADLYHSVSTGYAGILGSLLASSNNKPFILTEHGIYTREREEEIIKSTWIKGYFKDTWIKFFYNMSRFAYSKADKVITLFEKNKKTEVELGCDENKIMIIPNGIDVSKFEDIDQNKDDDVINIGAILRIVPIKDVKTMIMSFYIIKKEIKNAKLYLMGPIDEDEDYYNECSELVKNLELEDVIFTRRINIKDYVGKMDILLLSSISEGQPLAILEGLACKKPFVTTDVGSCRDLIYGNDDYGQAGFVVPVMNYEKMAEEVIKLCKNDKLRKNMGLNGYNRVSKLYTFINFINSYKNLYESYRK